MSEKEEAFRLKMIASRDRLRQRPCVVVSCRNTRAGYGYLMVTGHKVPVCTRHGQEFPTFDTWAEIDKYTNNFVIIKDPPRTKKDATKGQGEGT
jgi:hypothetical protein